MSATITEVDGASHVVIIPTSRHPDIAAKVVIDAVTATTK
jgi:hypothetical protein